MTTLEIARQAIYDLRDQIEALKQHSAVAQDELAGALQEADEVGSLLLDVQEESNEHRERADRFEKLLVEHKKTAEEASCACVTQWWPSEIGMGPGKVRKPLKSLKKINLN